MKWPKELLLVRHAFSVYNALKKIKAESRAYQEFKEMFENNPTNAQLQRLAMVASQEISLEFGDHNTPLSENEKGWAIETGRGLKEEHSLPDAIFVSPYKRTLETLELLSIGWPALRKVKVYEEERIREQEHGLALVHNDWRILQAMYPEQRILYNLEGRYYYRYPQGENVPDVRLRAGAWLTTLTRDFSGHKIMAITHHLTILAIRASLERLSAQQFIELDESQKPINCGVTFYEGDATQGKDGRLILKSYNKGYY